MLKGDIQWHWDHEQQQSFEELKQLVSSAPVLRFYNVNEPVTISVDASSKGLGVVLLQNKQPVAYGSRALTEPQSRYAQIEREMLAILYGCEKIDYYIYGRRAVIETDHKPLVAIYDKPLYRATPRLQRMLMKLQRYDLRIVKLAEIKDATADDENLSKLSSVVVSGWPNSKAMLPDDIQSYWNFRDEITVIGGLLYKSQRIFIPKALQREMLVKLHEAHLGIVKTKQRAREILFWRNMNSDIENFIKN
ncbi:unnamed protein product [Mytilus coruscus]|uniref:Reverse transcriptase/retrotransposon-derived protein RNase H-like domain-containing protein n=1 Tax=Mytilus coruscus TaxID=42192 RepID=A0A6J8C6R3_MYTCO|nr:unnamed protein product [Mytilus coruscus]